ncbi:hypothetical protein [Nitrobacter vulgaris]|uniref:Uncharacterized protein n=1 Tax=Nitrobacter vulgaris TaxID=29421 RepID=A0A1V4HWY9_NITVU|nr:hypothetical protein [Nitrobacter vulgaris]OPH82443.1 hypothetical protein B2M20_11630 [Nitrobacter vulgaris]
MTGDMPDIFTNSYWRNVMGNDPWKKGVSDVKQGKGAPPPGSYKSDQQRKEEIAGRAAEIKRQQDEANKKKK